MNILSLNVNGLGKGDFKLDWVRNLVNSHNIDVVGLQEIKRKEFSDMSGRRLWGSNDFEFKCVES